MNNIVDHPRRVMGTTNALWRDIEIDRTQATAELREVIECLIRIASDPKFDFAGEFVQECEHVLGEIEGLDLFGPSDAATVLALGRRLESVHLGIINRIISSTLAAG